jgi:hypothetical protein
MQKVRHLAMRGVPDGARVVEVLGYDVPYCAVGFMSGVRGL